MVIFLCYPLQNARFSDSGEYSCKAENLFGSDTTASDLIVTP